MGRTGRSIKCRESLTTRTSFTFKWESGDRRVKEPGSDGYEGTDVSYRRLPEIESDEEAGGIGVVSATCQEESTSQEEKRQNGQETPLMGRVEIVVRIGQIGAAVEILVLGMSRIDLLLRNDVLKRLKRLEILYGDEKPKFRFGELPVGLLAEKQEAPCTDEKIL